MSVDTAGDISLGTAAERMGVSQEEMKDVLVVVCIVCGTCEQSCPAGAVVFAGSVEAVL